MNQIVFLLSVFVAPHHAALATPPAAPVAIVAPVPAAAPVATPNPYVPVPTGKTGVPLVQSAPTYAPTPYVPPVTSPVVTSAPETTSTTTECNVTITDTLGHTVTFSPGPVDANGLCGDYPASNYGAPGDSVIVAPGPVTVTTAG